MSPDALAFLAAERAAWRPSEALRDLSDDDLTRPLASAHGWSGRDLMANLTYWQELGLRVARELALHEMSGTKVQSDTDWDARGGVVVNEEVRRVGLALPLDEVRSRFRLIPGELRSLLVSVPETRWLKNTEYENFFLNQTTLHYAAHATDLAAVLGGASSGGT